MSDSNTSCIRAAISAASLVALSLLGACTPQRTAQLSDSEKLLILEEIGLGSTLVGYDQPAPTTAPNLIAGDWLAIQCAQASGYFDRSDWTPVYANVVTSDFE